MAENDILEFKGANRFLSNFEGPAVYLDGVRYPHVEHAYQAAKSIDGEIRRRFTDPFLPSAKAKTMGSADRLDLRKDWTESVRLTIMDVLIRQKFLHKDYLDQLLETGDARLIEGNFWHDNFWGNCSCPKCFGAKKTNYLGRLLMKLRKEMQPFKTIFHQPDCCKAVNYTNQDS